MGNFIREMNKMFSMNECTDNGRITVDYCPNSDVIVVKSFNGIKTINPGMFSGYGLMMEIMKVADELYRSESELKADPIFVEHTELEITDEFCE